MAHYQLEIEGVSVVLVGNFNPAIFQPAWFAQEGLLPPTQAKEAVLKVVHPELTVFEADWVNLQVTRTKFVAETTNPSCYTLLRDLVVGIFRLLEHTPVQRLGINRQLHFRLNDEKDWHAFGDCLAPKEIWNDLLGRTGLLGLAVQAYRTDELPGVVNVRVESSRRVQPFAVFLEVNNDVSPPEEENPMVFLVDTIANHFDRMTKESLQLAEQVLDRASP